MKTLQQICVCALLAALTALAVYAILLARAATQTVEAIPGEVAAARSALVAEIQASRRNLVGEVDETRSAVLARSERQAVAIRRDMMAELMELRLAADRRAGEALARVDTALETVNHIGGGLDPVLDAARVTLKDADRTVVDLHPQILGLIAASKVTAGEAAQTMRDVRGSVPGFLNQGQDIAHNFQTATLEFTGVADNLNRLTKPKWYDRLLGYGLNGVVMYRNLNPATNLTIKGAQLLASRP